MTKLYRPVLVLAVLILIVLGLNASSQGTSSLTAEARKPVLSFKIEKSNIDVTAMGKQYTYSRQDLANDSSGTIKEAKTMFCAAIDYLKKIWTIFRVLVLE